MVIKNYTHILKNITNHTRPNLPNPRDIRAIADKVHFYMLIVVIIFGIIGNLISLFIFTRPNLNKKTNTGILYTLLCIFNLLTFIEDISTTHFFELFGNIYISLPCNIEPFLRRSLYQILSWIQVLICFDRFFLVIYPTKAHIMRKKVTVLKS